MTMIQFFFIMIMLGLIFGTLADIRRILSRISVEIKSGWGPKGKEVW